MSEIIILGAGLSGLAAAKKAEELNLDTTLYEKNSYIGGRTYTHNIDGFLFDEGPHVSFTKDEEIKNLLAAACDNKYFAIDSNVYNFKQSLWLKHPIQHHLYGLPVDMVEKILLDFIEQYHADNHVVNNYQDWLYASFGKTFTDELPAHYTRKYWTVNPELMTTDWVAPRIQKVNLAQILRGALATQDENFYHIADFRYPKHGGFVTYCNGLASKNIQTNFEVCAIDLQHKKLEFTNGKSDFYNKLISSLPITELVTKIKDVPNYVLAAADKLVCTSVDLVNIALKSPENLLPYTWFYVYDEDIAFARGNFPHLLSRNNVPEGKASLQLEVYHSKYKPLDGQDVLTKAVEDIIKIGLIRSEDDILFAKVMPIKFANVLFDQNRPENIKIVRQYLQDNDISVCGRYGEWDYLWTDDSIRSGWRAIEKVTK